MDNKVSGGNQVNINDSHLLKREIYPKDKKSLELLHAKYSARLRRHIALHIGSIADAEDLTQNVFIELSKSDGQYDGSADVEKYLLGITNNVIHRYYRQKAGSVKTIHLDSIGNLTDGSGTGPQADPAYQIESEELRKNIALALAKLPPKARQAIKLRFIDGLTIKQAAEDLGCSDGAFRKLISYGLKKIRLKLHL